MRRRAPGRPRRSGPHVPAAVVVGVLVCLPAATASAHWRVEAELLGGQTVAGTLTTGGFGFDAVAITGEAVRVAVGEPPTWSNLQLVCQIDQTPDGRVFVIRNLDWTGEVLRLRGALRLHDQAGRSFDLDLREIRKARFYFIRGAGPSGG